MSSGGYYCYFPMPFARSARMEIVNETGQEVQSFYYHINYRQLTQPPASDMAYFHATLAPGAPDTTRVSRTCILEGKGTRAPRRREHEHAGHTTTACSISKGTSWCTWTERRPVHLQGTGTEDYFNGGWYFNKGEFAAPYHGLILKDDTLDRIAAYRFHVPDAISFTSSLQFTIEHGDQNAEIADYSSTAYWYQLEPHAPFPAMLPAGARIPLRVVVPERRSRSRRLVPKDADSWP